jgi:DNA-binding MarR family transcriptional regulator
MSLTESQAKVLAALAVLESPTATLTVGQLCTETRLSATTVRAALDGHSYAGFVRSSASSGRPIGWRITGEGQALIRLSPYREFLPRDGTTNGARVES